MKTVLITGATSGIGLCIANKLHRNGYKVYGTSRSPETYKQKVEFELLALDVTSASSIRDCLTSLISKTSRLDVLINNAGIGVCGSAEETTDELSRKQFEANFWGTVNMTKAVLPFMRQQRCGTIITIGSLAGLIGVPFQSYYAASKHALEGFLKSLRFEVRPFHVNVTLVEPGFFRTDLYNRFEYATPVIRDYDSIRSKAMEVFSESISTAPSPEPVAEVILRIANAKSPRFSYRVGRGTKMLPFLQFISYRLFEMGTRRKFQL